MSDSGQVPNSSRGGRQGATSPPAPAVNEPLLPHSLSFTSEADLTDPSIRPVPPRWTRSTSRYSTNTLDSTPERIAFPQDGSNYYTSGLHDVRMTPSASMQDRSSTPPFIARQARPGSMASSHMMSASGSQNDYDSVYQLWRQSGTTFQDYEDETYSSFYDSRRYSSGMDLAKIEKYRSGAYDDSSVPAAAAVAEGSPIQNLVRGQGGEKGPKDYRRVGLAKYGPGKDKEMPTKKKWLILLGVAALVGVLVIIIVVPISQTLLKNDNRKQNATSSRPDSGNGGQNTSGTPTTPTASQLATWGTNGSTIYLDNGQSFVYINNFGGRWASQPLNDSAQAQNYTPPLSEEFDFSKNRILGVNLGGWLVTEPFIAPALYEPYENTSTPAVDEFTLSQRYLAEGGQDNLRTKMTAHYDTFITEQDFAQIAAAGLNWVRLPFGFWALETYANEPYLEGVSWNYVLKAIQWARKYGLRINLDLHAVPGSQNAFNHSGRKGYINFLQGAMGVANGQRTLDYIRRVTQFISQPEIRKVVPMLSIVNEPWAATIGQPALESWYSQIYGMMRNISGTGAGNGPYITIHDGFLQPTQWSGFLSGGDRVSWDTHPYICFSAQNNDPWDVQIMKPCQQFRPLVDAARSSMGLTVAGEISLATNDCGLYLNGVGDGSRFDGTYTGPSAGNFPRLGSCTLFDDWENYTADFKQGMQRFALTSMDAVQNFFFWTWKIGNSLRTGKPTSPMWSYSLGLQQGWMPTNPLQDSAGACSAQASRLGTSIPGTSFGGNYQDWQTGRAASYSPNTAQYPWPPQSIVSANAAVSQLPTYTRTKPWSAVATPTISVTATVANDPNPTASFGGVYNSANTEALYTAVAGCNYPADQYNLTGWNSGGWPCSGTGGQRRRRDIAPSLAQPTPMW